MNSNSYLLHYNHKNDSVFRLFCFPFAGSGASYFTDWQNNIHRDIEITGIQLPGRENRSGEPLVTDFPLLINILSGALTPYMDKPFAFFGHSMGAYICFELARLIRNKLNKEPFCLYLSGACPPHRVKHDVLLHKLDNEDFLSAIKSYMDIPTELLQNPELLAFYLPILRADAALIEKYQYLAARRLHCPIIVFSGREDKFVNTRWLQGWRKQTTGLYRYYLFDGGHFFIKEHKNEILKIIEEFIINSRELG